MDAPGGVANSNERERRRSQRVLLDVPIVVRGQSVESKPFREETFTISVSANGALLLLAAKVAVGQTLLLTNPETRDEQEGRVARFGSPYGGLSQVAVEFPRSVAEFWHMNPPPQSWARDKG
jgi:hypothetical protein